MSGQRLLSLSEAAEYIGVAEGTLRNWRSNGRIDCPSIKVGRLVKYRPEDLNAWLKKNEQIPA